MSRIDAELLAAGREHYARAVRSSAALRTVTVPLSGEAVDFLDRLLDEPDTLHQWTDREAAWRILGEVAQVWAGQRGIAAPTSSEDEAAEWDGDRAGVLNQPWGRWG